MAGQQEIYQVLTALGFKETELDKAPIEWLEHSYKRIKETAVLAMFEAANRSMAERQKEVVRDTFSNICRCCRCMEVVHNAGDSNYARKSTDISSSRLHILPG